MTVVTFSSCFYIIKSKFKPEVYVEWMDNLISIVDNFFLVIYTDENSLKFINTRENAKIKVIVKPMEQFYNYRYKEAWIKNHQIPTPLNKKTEWKLNMLWSEKVWFVNETIQNQYFDTEYYGWCDIGYFRNRTNDLSTKYLSNWPNPAKILKMDKNKIHYACVINSIGIMMSIEKLIKNKNIKGLPNTPIRLEQESIAGGFFILHKSKMSWWANLYTSKLELYLKNNYLVKDDQYIIIDCIYSNKEHFMLYREKHTVFDNWFMFQRLLL
jgi:hypothetical protein